MHAILYTRTDCTLCDKAAHILERLAAEGLLTWEKRDIEASPALTAAFDDRIPVVELVGGPRFEGCISEFRLRKALAAHHDNVSNTMQTSSPLTETKTKESYR
nr:glutaredoxin family protein [Ardenticatena sp.]